MQVYPSGPVRLLLVAGRINALLLAGVLSCNVRPTPTLDISREQAIHWAVVDATGHSGPGNISESRIDSTMAEFVTVAEADRRAGRDSRAADPTFPLWWVTLYGCFWTFSGPQLGPAPVYGYDRMEFTYPARIPPTLSPRLLAPGYGGLARHGTPTVIATQSASGLLLPPPSCRTPVRPPAR